MGNLNKRTINQFARICKELTAFAYRLKIQDNSAKVAIMNDNLVLVKDNNILYSVYIEEFKQKDNSYTKEELKYKIDDEVLYSVLIKSVDAIKNKKFTVKEMLKEHWGNIPLTSKKSISNKFSKEVKEGKIKNVTLIEHKKGTNTYIKI